MGIKLIQLPVIILGLPLTLRLKSQVTHKMETFFSISPPNSFCQPYTSALFTKFHQIYLITLLHECQAEHQQSTTTSTLPPATGPGLRIVSLPTEKMQMASQSGPPQVRPKTN